MKHFSYFPSVTYNSKYCKNITARSVVKSYLKKVTAVFYEYTIKDSERADIIAEKYYGSSDYTWVIYYVNDIHHPIYDWPLPYFQFISYLEQKYGSIANSKNTIHHYELSEGIVVDSEFYYNTVDANKQIVYCYEYEQKINDEKRDIKLLDDKYLMQMVNELRASFE